MKRILVVAVFTVLSTPAFAEKFSLGGMDIQPCSRTIWRNNGIFGLPAPTVQWGRQYAQLYLEISAPNIQMIEGRIRECGQQGVAAATLAALLANLGAAAPAFWGTFQSCMANTQWFNARLSVDSDCHY